MKKMMALMGAAALMCGAMSLSIAQDKMGGDKMDKGGKMGTTKSATKGKMATKSATKGKSATKSTTKGKMATKSTPKMDKGGKMGGDKMDKGGKM